MKILSLDTSSKQTGWAIFEDGKYIDSGCINLSNIKDSEERLREMVIRIKENFYRQNFDFCVVETPVISRNPKTQRLLTILFGAVFALNILFWNKFVFMSPSEWRKLIDPGKKPRKREELKIWSKEKVHEMFGIDVNDDIADAILIGVALCKKIDAKEDFKNNYI